MTTKAKPCEQQAKLPSVEGTLHVCAHTVAYHYWSIDVPLSGEDLEVLQTHAEERAKELIVDGVVMGELNCPIGDIGGDSIRGWWKIQW
jgi:hypothetical protein